MLIICLTSDTVRVNKTSTTINEVDDKVVVGMIKETLLSTDIGPTAQSNYRV